MGNVRRPMTVLFLGVTALFGGCAHFPTGPHPLYSGPALPAEQTATLSGYVGKVDDVDVSDMVGPFGLLPGCHVVTSRNTVGEDSPSGAWSVVMPKRTFAFRMQAGHAYEIQVQRQGSGSETSGLKMRAVELDASGKRLAEVAPVHGKADVQACHAWAAAQAPEEQPSTEASEQPSKQPSTESATQPAEQPPVAPVPGKGTEEQGQDKAAQPSQEPSSGKESGQ
jgi:hypothetical protein